MKKVLFPLLLFLAVEATGQRKAKDIVADLVNAYLQTEGSAPGVSVTVMQDGEIIYAEGFGYADVAAKKKVAPSTRFRAASVSKMMTATAVGKLVQEGKLDLDQPVQKYLPQFPEKAYPFTSRQLAGHLAGMPHYSFTDRMQRRFYPSVEDALTVFSHQNLLYEPGTRYTYSTHGYTLLSAVVEAASGVAFLDYMQREIFRPLGMTSTGPDLRNARQDQMAELYSAGATGSPVVIAEPEDPSYKWGAGGMVSTPSDLARLGNAYLNGFLRPEVVREMFQSQKLNSGEETGVGIGWRGSWDAAGRRVYEHAGAMGGARSVVAIFPEENFVVAVMTNAMTPVRIEEMAHVLALPFLTKSTPRKQMLGQAKGTVMLSGRGGEKTHESTLTLNGSNDQLVIDNDGEFRTYRLVYLQKDNL